MKEISYITDSDTWSSEFFFSKNINIRFSETDMFGHVNNISTFIYPEEARINFLKNVNYIQKLRTIPVVVDLYYLAKNEKGNICLTGRGRLINFDLSIGKPIPLTEDDINKLNFRLSE